MIGTEELGYFDWRTEGPEARAKRLRLEEFLDEIRYSFDLWWKDILEHLEFVHFGYKTFYEPGELFWGRVKLDNYKDYGPTYEETTKWSAYMAFDRSKDKTNYQNPELAIHNSCLEKDRL